MTTLEKLRAVAARRTAGEWVEADIVVSDLTLADAEFIAVAAATYDLLLDIAEAAKDITDSGSEESIDRLYAAVAALEAK